MADGSGFVAREETKWSLCWRNPGLRFGFVKPSSSLQKKDNLVWLKHLQIFQNPVEAIVNLEAIRGDMPLFNSWFNNKEFWDFCITCFTRYYVSSSGKPGLYHRHLDTVIEQNRTCLGLCKASDSYSLPNIRYHAWVHQETHYPGAATLVMVGNSNEPPFGFVFCLSHSFRSSMVHPLLQLLYRVGIGWSISRCYPCVYLIFAMTLAATVWTLGCLA
ncbi:hypothetical protein VNO77_27424 [Canavalia gladiata]|uniref:Uncharacterized protein n=1 Tax=Canavalia gladiata TaxID=3824 RepID=A0AAN9KUN5_CANGL